MAIEGPLRELGIHDVFQLLDLSRKTGALRVISGLRDNEGTVYFDTGRVIHATIRSNPHPLGAVLQRSGKITEGDLERARSMQQKGDRRRLGEILADIGAITAKELERQVRMQIEAVVFELMSWREGMFRFEERSVDDTPAEATIRISTESLLMEGARRIDEWSRIADKVPHLGVVPVLAAVNDDHPTLLDLLPNEWEMLTIIDGTKDLRSIATALGRSEFDIAKIAYGLVTTGVIELRATDRAGGAVVPHDITTMLKKAEDALGEGHPEAALDAARAAIAIDGNSVAARLLAARAHSQIGRHADAADELRRAAQLDPLNAEVFLELGYACTRRGDFPGARESWDQFLRLAPGAPEAPRVRAALESLSRLANLIEARAGV